MLKIIGSCLVIIAGTLAGFYASNRLDEQKKLLLELKNMIVLLKGEIRFSASIMGQAFMNISDKCSEPFKTFLRGCGVEMNKYDGRSLDEIWKYEVNLHFKDTILGNREMEKLYELGGKLGFLDLQMQLSYLEQFLEELDADIKEADNKIHNNSKLYKSLGIMGGILVVLIIL